MTLRTRTIVPVVILIFLAAVAGCRKFPTDSTPIAKQVAGIYQGRGDLGSGARNLRVGFAGPDSSGNYSGALFYNAATSNFSQVTVSAGSDTVWFRFSIGSTGYNAMATVGATSLSISFIAPTGLQPLRVNREIAGYNMSGVWGGSMYSAASEFTRAANLTMDQNGQSFLGEADVSFFVQYQLQFNTGATNVDAFQLSGTALIAGTQTPCLLIGNYSQIDTLRGVWQAGQSGEIDHGDFVFVRYYN
jgi:hypothetical protein